MRKPVVGVMGGSKATKPVAEMARTLGRLIAENGWILLNGGGDGGVMDASSHGARSAGGLVIGILPGKTDRRASQHLDVAIMTDGGDGRNYMNVLSSDVVIACPGKLGTRTEVLLALNNHKPVVLLGLEFGPELNPYRRTGQLQEAQTPDEAIEMVSQIVKGPAQKEGMRGDSVL